MPLGAGYVQPGKYETKKKHRQLDKVLCERCSDLCNGAMIPAVEDFTQKTFFTQLANQRQSISGAEGGLSSGPDDEFLELLGKALITPDELRKQLLEVRDRKAVVVMVVDLLDASGSLLTRVRDMVG